MNVVTTLLFLSALAAAHSGIRNIEVDGTVYPAFDMRLDSHLNVKRVEWSFKNTIHEPVSDVSNPAITCNWEAKAPVLKAIARAGSNATFRWTDIVRFHQGPVMTYMGYLPTPDTKPQKVKFFKIQERGFNQRTGLWANEEIINNKNEYTVQIPSDIKPGMYIIRTELLALHGNTWGNGGKQMPAGLRGPQFYPHCFNVEVTGGGKVTPEGVTIPGAYKNNDPGVAYNLNSEAKYIIPGPPLYAGKYERPTGPRPVVEQTGVFPPDLQAKYKAMQDKFDRSTASIIGAINIGTPTVADKGKGVRGVGKGLGGFKSNPDILRKAPSVLSDLTTVYRDIESFRRELKAANLA